MKRKVSSTNQIMMIVRGIGSHGPLRSTGPNCPGCSGDTKSLRAVLVQSAAVLMGPEEAFAAEERLAGNTPHQTTISAWQIRMGLITMLWQREGVKGDTLQHRHLGQTCHP